MPRVIKITGVRSYSEPSEQPLDEPSDLPEGWLLRRRSNTYHLLGPEYRMYL